MSNVLVTGGAGFIGSHLVDALVERGHRVRVLDALVAQVHRGAAPNLPEGVEFVHGDVRERALVDAVLDGIEVVYHQAAEVGVGQSMYEMERYVAGNTLATSVLLEALVPRRQQIKKLVVASSMSIYGEGEYRCEQCGPCAPPLRPMSQMEQRDWEVHCPTCGADLEPIPTSEAKPLAPASVYAVTKQDQEQLCLCVGSAYEIPSVALRYFNVYGPRQALSNPYTGIAAIFGGRLLNGQRPLVFEDGNQTRDFTHVQDIVQANLLALETDRGDYRAINVGTGNSTSVVQMANLLAEGLGLDLKPEIVGQARTGDIRHCVADISLAKELLGYSPSVTLDTGIGQLLEWVRSQQAVDAVGQATAELNAHGLVR
ncbi:MAG: NAD-dependent epimerase/dehydratase [Armatimonadetes bacterium]|nr:NAD-dependent epimerase/dehydratase [Armatimonadota bacterium]